MIKHIVMWRLKGDSVAVKKTAEEMKSRLEKLPGIIPEILDFEVGMNFNPSPAAMDVCLYSSFESKEALGVYQVHPDHEAVKAYIGSVAAEVAVVDYEI